MLKIFFLFLASCSDKESADIKPRDIGFMDVNAHPFLLIFLYFQLISTNSEWHHTARNHIRVVVCRWHGDNGDPLGHESYQSFGAETTMASSFEDLRGASKVGGDVDLLICQDVLWGDVDPEKSDSETWKWKEIHEIKTSMIEHVMEADWGHYGTLMFSQFGWFVGVWVDKWQDMKEKKEAPTVHHFTAAMNACAATSMFYVKANFEMSAL